MFRSQDQTSLKIFTNIKKTNLGELILRAMPVKDDQMSTFVKYMNGLVELGKKNNL